MTLKKSNKTNYKGFSPYIKQFKEYLLLEKGLSEHSIEAYTGDVEKLAFFLHQTRSNALAIEVTENDLEAFIRWLNELGLGAASQSRILSGTKGFFRFLLLEKMISNDPSLLLESPKLRRKIPQVLRIDEIQALLEHIDLSHPQGHRNRAIIEVLYACGLRVSELTGLRISNLFLDIGFIKVLGKNNKERLVPIGKEAITYLQLYMDTVRQKGPVSKDAEDIVFVNRRGKALSRQMIFLIVKDAAKHANLPSEISPHTFRHSFATHLVEGGADLKVVQDLLGHESITTTEIYTHLDTEYLRATILLYHPRSKFEGPNRS